MRSLFLVLATLAVLPLTLGCQTKLRECARLIGAMNAAGQEVDRLAPLDAGMKEEARAGAIARGIESRRGAIAAVDLADPKLKGIQADYLKMLERASTAARAREVAGDKDLAAATAAQRELSAAADDQRGLVQSVNEYCAVGGGK